MLRRSGSQPCFRALARWWGPSCSGGPGTSRSKTREMDEMKRSVQKTSHQPVPDGRSWCLADASCCLTSGRRAVQLFKLYASGSGVAPRHQHRVRNAASKARASPRDRAETNGQRCSATAARTGSRRRRGKRGNEPAIARRGAPACRGMGHGTVTGDAPRPSCGLAVWAEWRDAWCRMGISRIGTAPQVAGSESRRP